MVFQPALRAEGPMGRLALRPSGWVLIALAGLAAACVLAAVLLPGPWPAVVPLAAGGSLLSLCVALAAHRAWHRACLSDAARAVAAFAEQDAAPSLTCDADGTIVAMNLTARARYPHLAQGPLAAILRDGVANPAALLLRLQTSAEARGTAREEVATRQGRVRLSVYRIADARFLWRVETAAGAASPGMGCWEGPLPIVETRPDGTIARMNEAMQRLTGGRADALDRAFRDPPPPDDGVRVLETTEGPLRARICALPGWIARPGTVEADAQRDAAQARRAFVVIPLSRPAEGELSPGAEDLGAPEPGSAPRRTEAAPEEALLDLLPVAVVKMAPDGALRMANRLARSLLGEVAQPGARLPDLLEGLGRPLSAWLDEAAQGRGLGRPETMRAKRAEQETFVQVTLQRMRDGEETVLVAVLSDATELKTLEAQFVQSQKMQAIGQLAGGVAHDFNNLLTAISGHCDLLLLRHAPDDPDYADLVQINQNANRAASLVGQLLAFSRKQNLQLAPVDLRDSLSELTHLLNRLVGEKVRLTLSHDPRLKPIRADKRQLEQVIMNLVVNARDAMPDGGEIRIETEVRRLDAPFRRDRAEVPPGEYVIVRVADCGIGIPPDNLPKVFEPFFSTKGVGEGTGLGLSTAYGIVKQTGGYIFVDSAPGEGTTFSLHFPVHAPLAPAQPQPAAAGGRSSVEQAQGVVLLVEDEAPVRAFAGRALRMRGYTVLEAEHAEDALKLLEDPQLRIDVFVTDVIMPGMDGPSWVRIARQARPDARVVFMSGYAEENFADAQARIPNSVFLPKPFSLNDLVATVQDQLA